MYYGFKVGPFARMTYLDGTKTFEEAIATDPKYEQPMMVRASTDFAYSQIEDALAKGHISQSHYDKTVALIPLPTPLAPNISSDDVNNVIVGINNKMEYSIDESTTYLPYTTPFDLSGNHTVKVRVMAVSGVSNSSLDTVLTFTTNPVTPIAPVVTNDDVTNTVTGMTTGMEYKLDSAEYVAYDATTFNGIDFSGEHTLLVRVSAEGINPASADTTLIFTTN
ncbi:hypothetical protein KTC96_24665 (plasmid) [Clostridium estertheticum]|uniref:hypothetical protein n=1 Tax=Clostridium estertheticum TaxID=238834 RepID=UPI001C7DAB3B|nr:hypothetical protein [Clostridium estertheticum]MBX4259721.1 hypothetical protein [Clostridium estertheticum]WLC73308.1 hypothetical protein KTC96_24665 [Clostridium estertheticum]